MSFRIVFMGTPEFAVASLKALLDAGENVVAVVTAADKPAGRGRKTSASAVKTFALEHGLPVLQPLRLKSPEFLEELASYQADLQVVVAFRMLPESVWNMPEYGTINLHASLLPQYRGAAPINHAIINGEKQTGVTTFLLRHEIDTGHILKQNRVAIGEKDNAGVLHDTLMNTGARLLVQTINELEKNELTPIPQSEIFEGQVKEAPKIYKEFCEIDWSDSALNIYNKIRGLSPYPTAFTYLNGKTLKIYEAEYQLSAEDRTEEIGTYQTDGKRYLNFICSDGYLAIRELQIEGKKKMTTEEFLRGAQLS